MLSIAICDDDNDSGNKLASYIMEYAKEKYMKIELNCFTNPFELLSKDASYELLFLDIDMPEINGLEVGLKLKDRNMNCEIVYVTNYADYAYRSFSIRPFGYVVKPFSKEDIFKELNDFISKRNDTKGIRQVHLSDDKVVINLNADDILYFEYSSYKCIRVVTENEIYYMHGTLKYFYEKTKTYDFTYPHKSFIVNLMHIVKIDHFDMVMKNNVKVPIAQKKKIQFMKEYNMFLQKKIGGR